MVKRIDVLPDDVLLKIFDFYLDMYSRNEKADIEIWKTLVHVCRRWRRLVFQSPRRLNLRLYCTPQTPAKDTLDVWPPLPLIICGNVTSSSDTDNIIAALEQSNHVCRVNLSNIAGGQFNKVLAAMRVPFPELTSLRLVSRKETLSAISDSLLGGSSSSLRGLLLIGIPFPGLPNLLLSANHLVDLGLFDIPHSGYISPEAIVTLLSVLSCLESLSLGFRSPQSRPDWQGRSPFPPKRSTLPLKALHFKGVTEYLEELVTRIETPQLDEMSIKFFNQIDFHCPRLAQFINRTPTTIRPWALDEAHVQFNNDTVWVNFVYNTSTRRNVKFLEVEILCREPDWQISSIEQVCNSCLPPLSAVEDLYIERQHWFLELVWGTHPIENTMWLQLLLPFTAVKRLHLAREFAPGITAALRELVGGSITEVLPSLEYILVEGLEESRSLQEDIGQFVAARQLSSHDPNPIGTRGWRDSPW
jgi:hypothetical protein